MYKGKIKIYMRIKEIKICVRIIMTNSAIEFLRLSLKFLRLENCVSM